MFWRRKRKPWNYPLTRVKMYPSIIGAHKLREDINPYQMYLITEKLDGSNVTILKTKDGFRFFSRRLEITHDSEFGKGFLKWARKFFNEKYHKKTTGWKKNIAISGEWLGTSKLAYKSKCKFYFFGISKVKFFTNVDGLLQVKRTPLSWHNLRAPGLKIIPLLSVGIGKWKSIDEIKEKLVTDKMSNIDKNVIREGVVVTPIDDKGVPNGDSFKIVSDYFTEEVKKCRIKKRTKGLLLAHLYTEARVRKFITSLEEDGLIKGTSKEEYSTIFKTSDDLVNNLLSEEPEFSKYTMKDLRKGAYKSIRNYLDNENQDK